MVDSVVNSSKFFMTPQTQTVLVKPEQKTAEKKTNWAAWGGAAAAISAAVIGGICYAKGHGKTDSVSSKPLTEPIIETADDILAKIKKRFTLNFEEGPLSFFGKGEKLDEPKEINLSSVNTGDKGLADSIAQVSGTKELLYSNNGEFIQFRDKESFFRHFTIWQPKETTSKFSEFIEINANEYNNRIRLSKTKDSVNISFAYILGPNNCAVNKIKLNPDTYEIISAENISCRELNKELTQKFVDEFDINKLLSSEDYVIDLFKRFKDWK